jgi:hypothetical protein
MSGLLSKGKPKVVPFNKAFKRIQAITESILQEALGATLNQQQFQTALFALLQPEFDRLAQESDFADQLGTGEARATLLRSTIDRNSQLNQQAAKLSSQAATASANLGTLTDDDRQLISGIIGNARAVGQSEIDAFVAGNFRASNEVAAARGLRPTDAPIGNVRGRIAEESIRQKGLLESQLASQQAQLGLDIPQQRFALQGQFAGQQLGLAQAGNQFQAALQQNATANRLNLAQTAGQLGLGLTGLAGTGPGVLGASRPAVGQTNVQVSGGISTKMLKINGQPVDADEVLDRLQALPIEAWQYLWERGEDAFQVGPYAEDFQKAFGGDSYRISFLHALGVSMVALQALTGRLEAIEDKLGIRVAVEVSAEAI